eukprot:scaffold9041_cov171-Cylindrotheca_fusiformis.AAC.4
MTAVSPYSPHRRNTFLRASSSSVNGCSSTGISATGVAFFLLVVKFWGKPNKRQRLLEVIRKWPSLEWPSFAGLTKWIKDILLGGDNGPTIRDVDRVSPLHGDSIISDSPFHRAKSNQAIIQSVLGYWFGSGTPDQNQKNLWMIAASSDQLRAKVDREIAVMFEGLLMDLSSHKGELWKEWCLDRDGMYGARGKVAAIIVLDQFSRHILRYYDNSSDHVRRPSKLPTKQSVDSLAYETAQLFVEEHQGEIKCGMIPLPWCVFSLMPYRHASIIDTLEYTQKRVEEFAALNAQIEAMLARFRKATNRRLAVLQDEARRSGKKQQLSGRTVEENAFADEEILETFQFEADMTHAVNHPVFKTISRFLADQGINQTENVSPRAMIVSLSGGVDSMVIASVLSYMNKCGYNLNIIAVHIDYGNRPEASAEADFVRRYCESLGIGFRCRRIDEVTRGVTSRDDYERISREIRYTSYKEAVEVAQVELDHDQREVGVVLGHHRGDLRENVLSNAHKGAGPLDLSGMTSVSKNDGVTLYRPLLPLEKSFIMEYAHTFGVPYFKDTTPHWSTRGKLRNKLLPLLQEIYGEGSMNNLSNLATESDECRTLLNESLILPFLHSIVRKPMGIMFDSVPWRDQAFFFWKFVLREALHSAKLGMFTDKSVRSFLARIKGERIREGWLQCRKDYGVYLQRDGKVFIFYPSSFPWNVKNMYNIEGEVVEFNTNRDIGPWTVRAETANSNKVGDSEVLLLAKKAIPSMEALMDGHIEYFIQSPNWNIEGRFQPRPLKFCRFRKPHRPAAWKNTDLKVQSTLPLLGNDDIANGAIGNEKEETNSASLVRVVLSLNAE